MGPLLNQDKTGKGGQGSPGQNAQTTHRHSGTTESFIGLEWSVPFVVGGGGFPNKKKKKREQDQDTLMELSQAHV